MPCKLTRIRLITGILIFGPFLSELAIAELRVTPVLGVEESFLENKTPTLDESGQITRVSPGVRIESSGAKSSLSLDYNVNALYYQSLAQEDEVNQTLDLQSSFTHIQDRWVSYFNGNIRQSIVSPDGLQILNPDFQTENKEELRTFRIGSDINGFWTDVINYQASISADYADFEKINATDSVSASILLESNNPGNFSWRSSYTSSVTGNAEESFQIDTARIGFGYRINLHYSTFLSVEKSDTDNSFLDQTTTHIGVQWLPNRNTSVRFGAGKRGDDSSYTLDSHLISNRATYKLTYEESITSVQNLLVNQSLDPQTFSPTSQGLSIEPILSKKGNLSVTLNGRRTSLSIAYFKQIISESERDIDDTETDGLSVNATRSVSSQSSVNFQISRQESDTTEENRLDDFSLAYNRQLSKTVKWSAELGRTRQTSNIIANEIEQNYIAFGVDASF